MKRQDILTCALLILIGVAMAIVAFVLIEVHQPPRKTVKTCNDGWSIQEENGKIYESYIPENDTCKKEK